MLDFHYLNFGRAGFCPYAPLEAVVVQRFLFFLECLISFCPNVPLLYGMFLPLALVYFRLSVHLNIISRCMSATDDPVLILAMVCFDSLVDIVFHINDSILYTISVSSETRLDCLAILCCTISLRNINNIMVEFWLTAKR